MHSSDLMLVACLTILIDINKQQLLTDTYLTNSTLTIYLFQNEVYILILGKVTSNDIMHHEIKAIDWSRNSVAMGIGKSSTKFWMAS